MPWRACEAMHWALGEAEMCRRANVLPFPVSAARADPHQPGAGRVAQRDRMRGNTRVFEGRDLSDIASSSFNSVDSKGHSTPQLAPPVPSSMAIPSISSGQGFPGYDGGEEDDDDEEEEKGPRARRRRIGGETRLPGLRELQLEEERPALQPEEAVEEAAER